MRDPYDLLPYTEHAYAESSPDHIRVMARVSGWAPAFEVPALTPRVLELGCGRGGNLLPLAATWGDATFVGVDRSTSQIRDAVRVAEAAELRNITFFARDFDDVALPDETFDFVLCHGVYSWISPAERRRLLARVRASLSEAGIAYVSFNTLPGWYGRLAARDWLRFAARSAATADARSSVGLRQSLVWLRDAVSPEQSGYRVDLGRVHDRLVETDAAYLAHEFLADEHHPVYASTFVEEADAAGLAYLGDASPRETAFELLPDDVNARARDLGTGSALVLADFVRNTAFRRALVVRKDTAIAGGYTAPRHLDARALTTLRVSSRLRPPTPGAPGAAEPESFEVDGGVVQVSGVARAALRALAGVAPRSMPLVELAEAVGASADALAEEVKDLWLAAPGVHLHEREPDIVTRASAYPRADPVARWHAIDGGPVTNAWHHEVALREPVVRYVLGRLDGKTSASDLVDEVARREARLTRVEAQEVVLASLDLLARSALLLR